MNIVIEKVLGFLKGKKFKRGSISTIMILVAIGLVVGVNILSDTVQTKNWIKGKWDLTSNNIFSIGDTTKKMLGGLNSEVEIYGLFDIGMVNSAPDLKGVTDLLQQYSKYPKVKIKYVDPEKDVSLINQLDPENIANITPQQDLFVLKCGNKIKKLNESDIFEFQYSELEDVKLAGSKAEQAFTGAIKYISSEKTPTIYFTEGHKEIDMESSFTLAKSFMEKNNNDVKTLNLLTVDKVPEEAQVLVIASPKKDLIESEQKKIREYLDNGGSAVFMFDSLASGVRLEKFNEILEEYDVIISNDKVKENEEKKHLPNKSYDIIPSLQQNEVTATLDSKDTVLFMSKARSLVALNNKKDTVKLTSLIKSSNNSVGESIDKKKGANIKGPLDLAMASERKIGDKTSRVIVIGNAEYLSDLTLQQYTPYGLPFFLTSINWVQGRVDNQMIMPKQFSTQSLQLTSAFQVNVARIFTLVVLPLIIFGFGLFVWIRRRHL